MSDRHLFTTLEGLVPKALRGIVASNPRLRLDETNRVVFDSAVSASATATQKVSIISGGGSGHEPAWSGYVGTNMLSAAVAGDVFASPSTKQILAAIDAVASSSQGVLLVITNYTGDCLHFGLAAEKTKARGIPCRMLICGDDVSIGGKASGASQLVGRRGLAGQIGVLKILGAAANAPSGSGGPATLDGLYELGTAVNAQIVSIAATLDHCHVPGRTEHGVLGKDEVEIGTGPHNEPGYRKLSPAPTAEGLVREILRYLLDETDPERGYVHFAAGDETALLVSNFGGMSNLELGGLVDELLGQLLGEWKIAPVRVYAGCLETSLNAPAFSVSIVNLSGVARTEGIPYSLEDLKGFLDTRTDTAWEAVGAGSQHIGSAAVQPRASQIVTPTTSSSASESQSTPSPANDLLVPPTQLTTALQRACTALSSAEPDLTKWDTLMGDGDCGLTLQTGADALLDAVNNDKITSTGSIVTVLAAVEEIVESRMGGTLGGILGIFFVALRRAVQENVQLQTIASAAAEFAPPAPAASPNETTTRILATSLLSAVHHLSQYTPAQVGDRTVMDTLIPFAEAMHSAQSFEAGVQAAVAGAEKTRTLKPRLGRATYVGVETGEDGKVDLVPDPGAWGVMVAIRGLLEGLAQV
ncbi:dihydroxyacetone kinase [Chaetomium sp. MPI-SDFR-AT-0129]|nr:dihydroxyacetone kinase [Chaetomium sp. MPI-SDFR-AT-0129]